MRKHKGIRPHDLVILLKIITLSEKKWYNKDIAQSLYISPSEVSESLNRSVIAKLIDYNKERVNRQNLMEFIKHGLRYVFPAETGTMVRGIPTAHSYSFMKQHIKSELQYVWPDIKGETRGLAIQTLYGNQVKAVKEDEKLYKLLALVDVLRIGKVREVKIATKELEKMILK